VEITGLRPFRALIFSNIRSVGRCPTLLITGLSAFQISAFEVLFKILKQFEIQDIYT
jgi:hypothetical protein